MTKLSDMKIPKKTKKQQEAEMKAIPTYEERERYPYGLELHLEKRELEKTNSTGIEVGQMVKVDAIGKVTRVSIEDESTKRTRQSATIQIQKLAIAPKAKTKQASLNSTISRVTESRRA